MAHAQPVAGNSAWQAGLLHLDGPPLLSLLASSKICTTTEDGVPSLTPPVVTANGVCKKEVAGISTSALEALTLAMLAATLLGGLSRETSLSPIPVPGSRGRFIEALGRPMSDLHAVRKLISNFGDWLDTQSR